MNKIVYNMPKKYKEVVSNLELTEYWGTEGCFDIQDYIWNILGKNLFFKEKIDCGLIIINIIFPLLKEIDLSKNIISQIKLYFSQGKKYNYIELNNLLFVLENKITKIEIFNKKANIEKCLKYLAKSLVDTFRQDYESTYLSGIVNYYNQSDVFDLCFFYKLIWTYLRTEKQFNIEKHKNSNYEKVLKEILFTYYDELQEVDKMQAKDIIEEYYNIDINNFDILTHKTIQREYFSFSKGY